MDRHTENPTDIEERISDDFEAGTAGDVSRYLEMFPNREEEVSRAYWAVLLWYGPEDVADSDSYQRAAELAELSRSSAATLTERFRELGVTNSDVADGINLPQGIILLMQKRLLTDIPERAIVKLARYLRQSRGAIAELITVAVASRPKAAPQYRAIGTPEASSSVTRSFEEVMNEMDRNGKLSVEQTQEWVGRRS